MTVPEGAQLASYEVAEIIALNTLRAGPQNIRTLISA